MTNGIITEFDSKEVMKVRMRFGAEGYLAYVAIQELLYRHIHHALARDYDAIASEICVDANLVKGVVEQLDLFILSDTHFVSASINAHFESKRKLSESKAKGGYARWNKQPQANAPQDNANAQSEQTNAQDINANAQKDIANAQLSQANAPENGANAQELGANAQDEKRKEAKENIISDKNAFCLLGEQARAGEGEEPPKPKRKRKTDKDPETVRLNSEARELFKSVYLEKFGSPYVWGAVDAGQMSNLLGYIRVSRSERKNPLPIDTDSMIEALGVFLRSINDNWVLGNYSVKVIASKYNEIISRIKGQRQQYGTIKHDPKRSVPAPDPANADMYYGQEDDTL